MLSLPLNSASLRTAAFAIASLSTALALQPAYAKTGNSLIESSVNNSDRPAGDRDRDESRKPKEIMTFFGVEPGNKILEVGAGGGYYTELLSRAVGDAGYIYAYNPFIFLRGISDEIRDRYSDGSLKNVVLMFGSLLKIRLPDEHFDSAFFINTYHDIQYSKEAGESISPVARASLAEVHRVMKPGGTLGIVDHKAAQGFSREQAAAAHRVNEDIMKADMLGAGFVFVAKSDILANTSDDGTQAFFNVEGLRGNTNRIVYTFRKPE